MLQVTPSDMFISYLHTSCLKILKSSIFHVGTQKMQLHSAREDPNLLPDIVKYNWLQQMAPKNSSDPSWQILGTHYSTLHSPFYTRLFAWRKWFYHVWMHVYSRVALCLLLYCSKLGHRWKIFALQISVNVRNTYMHPLQKNFTDIRYAGDSAVRDISRCCKDVPLCHQEHCGSMDVL